MNTIVNFYNYFLGLVMRASAPYSGKTTWSFSPDAKRVSAVSHQLSPPTPTIGMFSEKAMVFITVRPILRPVKLPGPLKTKSPVRFLTVLPCSLRKLSICFNSPRASSRPAPQLFSAIILPVSSYRYKKAVSAAVLIPSSIQLLQNRIRRVGGNLSLIFAWTSLET